MLLRLTQHEGLDMMDDELQKACHECHGDTDGEA